MTRPSVGSSTQMPERHQTKWPPGAGRIVPSLPEMPRGLLGPWVSSGHPAARRGRGGMSMTETQAVVPGAM